MLATRSIMLCRLGEGFANDVRDPTQLPAIRGTVGVKGVARNYRARIRSVPSYHLQ